MKGRLEGGLRTPCPFSQPSPRDAKKRAQNMRARASLISIGREDFRRALLTKSIEQSVAERRVNQRFEKEKATRDERALDT